MAILDMQEIHIYALNKYCNDILEALQISEVVELKKVPVEDSVFYNTDTSSARANFNRNIITLRKAAQLVGSYCNIKNSPFDSLRGRISVSKDEYLNKTDDYSHIIKKAYEIIRYDKKISELKAEILKLENQIESLVLWQNLDVSLTSSDTVYTSSVVGTISRNLNLETLIRLINSEESDLDLFDVEVVYSDEKQTCIFAICYKKDMELFQTILRKIGFIQPTFTTDELPKIKTERLKSDIKELRKSINEFERRIIICKDIISELQFYEDYFVMKSDRYAQMDNISYSPHSFVMSGYVPKKDGEKIKRILFEGFGAEVELKDINTDDAPVILSNNKFSEPVESVVLSYSPPNRKEYDPTGIMAIFYYLFFGLMFSDAGYGLVMSASCGFLFKKFPDMEKGLRNFFKLFFWCGVSTFFWGLMFGSFFGDAVKVISEKFFGVKAPVIMGITTPIWFNPTDGKGPTTLLMFSFLLGLVHLFSGLIIEAVNYIRNNKFFYAITDDLSWIFVVGGSVLILLSTEMLSSMVGFMLPSVWKTIGGIIILFGAVLILLYSAHSKHPLKRFIKGAYNLYGVTGYLSDILSYSRLLALGLATGVVAQVFNQLGAMFGNGIIGVIGFATVFIIGHTLNIGINALGAYVHTNRLQFVEFFGKFYQGGGREFRPFKTNTKYYRIKEDF